MFKNSFVVVVLTAIIGLCASVASAQVVLSWSLVGNAGNAGDPSNFGMGAVAYEYRIGAFEVTNAQYAEFLNAVAASDPRGLFNANMGTDPRGGITRSGTAGSFTYSVRTNMGNKPVNFVNSLDAIRMANWLTNGQGSGSTESGVYTLNGNTVTAITRNTSNPNQVFLPTENEWKKAALHQPASMGGDTDNFWKYPTRSNVDPIAATATATGDIANPTATTVNWQSGADWNGQNGNVTTVGSCQNTSFYGAFDMAGNVEEWLENTSSLGGLSTRAITGGTFFAVPTFGILPEDTYLASPLTEFNTLGFRFASFVPVPQISTVVTRATMYFGATGTSASTLLATDKLALLPGQLSTFANYTNYSRGLNGIVVDVNGLPSGTTNAQMLSSLQFATWDGIAAGGFVALPGTVVPTVAIAVGGGAGGSARVIITFADNAVQNTWLRVTVLSNANTGLAANDVFYFGNVIGEFNTGNTATRLRVNATDTGAVRSNQSTAADSASVTNIFDVNRDGRVNATDIGIVRSNQQTAGIVAPIIAP